MAHVAEPNGRLLSEQELAEAGPPEAVRIPITEIDPDERNPRRMYAEIDQLAESIADPKIGLLQPILVRREGNRYRIVAGHRRLAAFQLLRDQFPHDARWRSIPAAIRRMDDDAAYLALITAQVHTKNFTPREEAAALEQLAATGLTITDISERLHRTKAWASKRLRVYADAVLSPYVQTGRLAASVAEELLLIADPKLRKAAAERAVKEHWSQAYARAESRKFAADRQIARVEVLARELLDILSSVDSGRIPVGLGLDLNTLARRIDVISGRRPPRLPTVEQAQRQAGVKPKPNGRQQKRTRFRTE